MNFRRCKFFRLLDRVIAGEVAMLVVAHKDDPLARCGFELIEWRAGKHGCENVVANQESLSPQRELVEDLLAIVDVFFAPPGPLIRSIQAIHAFVAETDLDNIDLSIGGDAVTACGVQHFSEGLDPGGRDDFEAEQHEFATLFGVGDEGMEGVVSVGPVLATGLVWVPAEGATIFVAQCPAFDRFDAGPVFDADEDAVFLGGQWRCEHIEFP
jgi:hypothetical protein